MEIFESSDYVIARAKVLAPYFAQRGWFVTAGKCNTILFGIPSDQEFDYTVDELAQIVAESDHHCKPTGLKITTVKYMFFQNLILVNEFLVISKVEIDK